MPQPELGAQLRSLRDRSGYTRADVAAATGLSASFLALVESGKSDISISRLIKLTELFDVGLADLLPARRSSSPEIIRKGDHRELFSEAEKMTLRLLTNQDMERPLQPIISTIAPGGASLEWLQHTTDVFLYVLAGELTLSIDGQKTTIVREGDSVYLEAGSRRSYRNDADVSVSWLGIVAHPAQTGRAGDPLAARRPVVTGA